MSPLRMLVFAVVAIGVLASVSGAQLTSLTPALAQESTNATSPETAATPEEGEETETTPPAMPEEHGQESASAEIHQDVFTVRDSVFALLADQTIPASGFIHLSCFLTFVL